MAKQSQLQNNVLARTKQSATSDAGGQVFDVAIASACRYLDGGITTFINLARAAESSDPRVAWFLDEWDSLDARAQNEATAADALCKRMRYPPIELLQEVAVTAVQLSGNLAGILVALALPEIVETGIQSALRRDGLEDRRMLLQHSGFLPVPRGATVGILNQVAANAAAANRNGEFFVPFEQDILEASEETADAARHIGSGHTR